MDENQNSKIWKYFTKDTKEAKYATCNLCKSPQEPINRGNNTAGGANAC